MNMRRVTTARRASRLRLAAFAVLTLLGLTVGAYALGAPSIAPHDSNEHFSMVGDVCCLRPGVWRSIGVTITNPGGYVIEITRLSDEVSSSPPGCEATANIALQQSGLSARHSLTVPARSSVDLSFRDRPKIELKDLPVNQDVCKNQRFEITYSAMARFIPATALGAARTPAPIVEVAAGDLPTTGQNIRILIFVAIGLIATGGLLYGWDARRRRVDSR